MENLLRTIAIVIGSLYLVLGVLVSLAVAAFGVLLLVRGGAGGIVAGLLMLGLAAAALWQIKPWSPRNRGRSA